MNISVNYEDTEIATLLKSVIKHPNDTEIIKLLSSAICNNHRLAELFIKCTTVDYKLPGIYEKGTIVKVPIDEISYSKSSRDVVKNSRLNIGNDMMYATIEAFRGYDQYSEYSINHEWLDGSGEVIKETNFIQGKYIILLDDI